MTIQELYEWAIEKDAEDFEIEIQYRDGGGFYCGVDVDVTPEINSVNKTVLL